MTALQRLLERPMIRKLYRYSMTSVVGLSFGQGSLYYLTAVADWSAVPANLLSVTVGAVPSYLMNRYWTWQKRGRNRVMTELVPFWVMTLLGLLVSTLLVAYAEDHWDAEYAINIASITGFGIVWMLKFVVLDRVLFHVPPPAELAEPELIEG